DDAKLAEQYKNDAKGAKDYAEDAAEQADRYTVACRNHENKAESEAREAERWSDQARSAAQSAGSWSDAVLKEHIEEVANATQAVMQLQPKSYYFKQADFPQLQLANEKQFGLLAQELEAIFPHLVTTKTTSHGNLKSVNYIGLLPVLIKAIQEQQQQINQLQNTLLSLTQNNSITHE
ncbi:MAG: tail fiber domain-containing protein, partial [Chitinophagaceae bacterium]